MGGGVSAVSSVDDTAIMRFLFPMEGSWVDCVSFEKALSCGSFARAGPWSVLFRVAAKVFGGDVAQFRRDEGKNPHMFLTKLFNAHDLSFGLMWLGCLQAL